MELNDILYEKKDGLATEVKRVLFETNGVLYFLPRLMGIGRAMQMLLTGEMVLAQDALIAGLLTKVVAQEQLMEYAIKANNGQHFNLYYSMEENR